MTARTRYFVIVSLLVVGVGLGTGLVAYYVGFPAGAFTQAGGPAELQLVPRNATVVAYANVGEIMASDLRQRLRRAIPIHEDGQKELEERTGINIETDIDRIIACLNPDPENTSGPGAGMVVARGRFNETKIESLMREHGAQVEDYRGKRLIVADSHVSGTEIGDRRFAAAFIEPGLVALGSTKLVRSAIDLHQTGDNPQAGLQSVTGNEELMNLVRSLESGNAWAVGRFDALQSQARLPQERRRHACRRLPGSRSAATSTAASAERFAPRRATKRPPTTFATSSAGSWPSARCSRLADRRLRR